MNDQIKDRLAALSPAKLELLEKRLQQQQTREPIAIVGMACNFPGAPTISDFWDVIHEGRNETQVVPDDRWPVEAFYDPDPEIPGRTSAKWACMIDEIGHFDPVFFGIAPREATRLDPQQRLLLSCTFRAMEHASISASTLAEKPTGVFVGVGQTDYSRLMSQYDNSIFYLDAHCGTGGALSICANRISYAFNFSGPSKSIDTACSSALVAVHDAIQSLRAGECDAAFAGGVNVCLSPDTFISLSKARMLSPSGACRPFDASANGYVRGEGCGVVLLKRLRDAIRDGDHVHAVIRGSAVNHGGRTSGISAPNGEAQRAVIRAALADGRVTPEQIQYVEAHGTGTPLGDPIEVEALGEIFSNKHEDQPVYLTSVKANIGHTEIAAGIAGLIKTTLMMTHGVIPPQASLSELNPHLQFDQSRIRIPREGLSWDSAGPRMAGVSSFGFGGTNAHLVMQSYRETESQAAAGGVNASPLQSESPTNNVSETALAMPFVLPISAKTSKALKSVAHDFCETLNDTETTSLADVIYTSGTGRQQYDSRAAVVATSESEMRELLNKLANGKRSPQIQSGQRLPGSKPVIAGLFTGQGSQFEAMAMQLYDHSAYFRQQLDHCDEIIQGIRGQSLLNVIRGDADYGKLNQTTWTQPALFSIEYALAKWWMNRGVTFDFLLGHSVGEIAAATIANVFDLESGIKLICRRAELMQALPEGGSMAVLFTDGNILQPYLEPYSAHVSVAAFNGQENTTISGTQKAVQRVVDEAAEQGIAARMLDVSHAFHSSLMEPMLDEFYRFAATIKHQAPEIPIVSNLTGKVEVTDVFDETYWRDHVRNSVMFAQGVDRLVEEQVNVLIETGPSATLIGMAKRCQPKHEFVAIPSLKRGQPDDVFLATATAKAYVNGIDLHWGREQSTMPKRVQLPPYPLNESDYWFKPEFATTDFRDFVLRIKHLTPMLGKRQRGPGSTSYENRISDYLPRHLRDHRVRADCVVPAAAFVDMALAAARDSFDSSDVSVENLQLPKALFLTDRQVSVHTKVTGDSAARKRLEVFSQVADADYGENWELNAVASITQHKGNSGHDIPNGQAIIDTHTRRLDREQFYELMADRGLNYGPHYQVIETLYRNEDSVFATTRLHPSVKAEAAEYLLHPAIGDGCLQAMTGVVPFEADGSYCPDLYLPVGVRKVSIYRPLPDELCFIAKRVGSDDQPGQDQLEADIAIVDQDDNLIASIQGVRVQKISSAQRAVSNDPQDWLYRVAWQPIAPTGHNVSATDQESGDSDSVTSTPSAATGEVSARPQHWLVIGDDADWLNEFQSAALESASPSPESSQDASTFTRLALSADTPADGKPAVDPSDSARLRNWLSEWRGTRQGAVQIVIAHGLSENDFPADSLSGDVSLDASALRKSNRKLRETFRLLAEIMWVDFGKELNVWLVARSGRDVIEADTVDPRASAIHGLAQVATQEMRQQNVRVLDLQSDRSATETAHDLLHCIDGAGDEPALAIRNGALWVPRLVAAPEMLSSERFSSTIPEHSAFRVRLGLDDTIDGLRYQQLEREAPPPGKIEIEVRAAGLNFSDVLKALGLYPGIVDKIVPLGLECSGVISAVGQGVTKWKPGDEVMAVVPYGFASHCITDQDAAMKKPEDLDHEDAAAIPLAFLTAEYCLRNVANLQKGERVLIHAGAGGVGLAAIQIAQSIGAEVFATAGSDEKRDYLRGLGVEHVMNSRTLEFADEIAEITSGQGVDVVLNSIPGDAIDASLKSLAAYGRFVEIGKIDIYSDRPMGLSPFQDNLTYAAVDLDRLFRQRPEIATKLMAEIADRFEQGVYEPLNITLFSIENIVGAFRFMSQRKNIGKIVLTVDPVSSDTTAELPTDTASASNQQQIRSDASYLITGGLGALGVQTARWLSAQGAGGIVLLSRRGGEAAESVKQSLHDLECPIAIASGDVCDAASLQSALESVSTEVPPIKGILHAAGVLRDRLMNQMTDEDFSYPLPAKTVGTWNLHEWTLQHPVDFMVLFSSVSSVLGTVGQANYGAANAFMDGFQAYRNAKGMTTLSVNWGAFDGSGMAADLGEMMQSQGVYLLPTQASLALMGAFLTNDVKRATVFRADWERFGGVLGGLMSGDLQFKLIEKLASLDADSTEAMDESTLAIKEELAALDPVRMSERLQFFFADQLSEIMGIDPEEIDPGVSLTTMGMDSLMAMELGNKMQSALAIEMPMSIYLQGPTIDRLTEFVVQAMTASDSNSAAETNTTEAVEPTPVA